MAELTAWNRMTGIKAVRLAETEGLSREDWLGIRNKGVGGSDVSAIAGLNPWKSAIDVYLDKTNRMPEQPDNEKMKWGRLLEEPVATEYADKKLVKVSNVKAVLQDTEKPYYLANIDRLILKDKETFNQEEPTHFYLGNKGNGILEVKTTGWGQSWENEEIPQMYYCQVQWYMHICKLQWSQFAVLIQGSDFVVPEIIEYNPIVCKNLCNIVDRFWNENVLKDVPPEYDNSERAYESLKLLYPNFEETEVFFPEEFNELINMRFELNESIKLAEKQKKIIDSKVLSYMKNNKFGYSDFHKVTRVLRHGTSFNSKQLKEDDPNLYMKYLKSSESTYPLFKKINKK